MNPLWAQLACFAASVPEALSFELAARRVKESQLRLLKRILRENAGTEYGRRCGFGGIKSSEEYQSQVPLADYSSLSPCLERIASGEHDLLFPGTPLCLQPTSGTTSTPKLIPFTPGLREDYRRAVSVWNFDLQWRLPALVSGKSYWSISPVLSERRLSTGGIPVGFLDDTEYLPPSMAALLRKGLAVPSEIALVQETRLFRYLTMAFLLKTRDLVFISVWNPTFLLILLESLRENWEAIADDIARGELSSLGEVPEPAREGLAAAFSGGAPRRAAEIRALFQSWEGRGGEDYGRLWPDLGLISCWEDAEARPAALRLRQLFPGVKLQPKGLMATEGVISIPLHRTPFPALALRSHFFEFIPQGDDDRVRGAWEVEQGGVYEVVITTAGGLYRYRLGDLVKVRGFYHGCPLLEFLGRGRHSSDFHGEKLHQSHVAELLAELLQDRDPARWFALLAPDGAAEVDHYTLYLACDAGTDTGWLEGVAPRVERSLRGNFHYDYCRKLGQLQEVEVCLLPLTVPAALERYLEEQKRRGIREGDVKPALLDNRPVWKKAFGV